MGWVWDEFKESGGAWAKTGGMLAHTLVSNLKFRSEYYRRLVSTYLDGRTGISFGFLAWQLPLGANFMDGEDMDCEIRFPFGSTKVRIPGVWVIVTRSGCDKTKINPATDLVRMGLVNGRIIVDLPSGIQNIRECKPSYDTLTILSHALGNATLCMLNKEWGHAEALSDKMHESGVGITHWHDYPEENHTPQSYFRHGENRPPVACSTLQSAIYSYLGKLECYAKAHMTGQSLSGDIHMGTSKNPLCANYSIV